MFNGVVTDTNIVMYLMIAVGVIGVLAKVMNQITLRRMVKAAGNMSKSTHKLMKLVRAKYEHACMMHDKVENVDAFVEKYIYEYRGILFRVHTWRQLEIQTIWFSGILAVLGAASHYMTHGICEQMYQYIAVGAAEMLLLFVVSQLSDEQYKIEAVKNYMVDYLENACAHKYHKVRQAEREEINVIQPEASGTRGQGKGKRGEKIEAEEEKESPELSINIEGEPRHAKNGEAARQVIRRAVRESSGEKEETALKEETIRQILEEFLA